MGCCCTKDESNTDAAAMEREHNEQKRGGGVLFTGFTNLFFSNEKGDAAQENTECDNQEAPSDQTTATVDAPPPAAASYDGGF